MTNPAFVAFFQTIGAPVGFSGELFSMLFMVFVTIFIVIVVSEKYNHKGIAFPLFVGLIFLFGIMDLINILFVIPALILAIVYYAKGGDS